MKYKLSKLEYTQLLDHIKLLRDKELRLTQAIEAFNAKKLEACEAVNDWLDAFEAVDFDETLPEVPEDLEVPELSPADELEMILMSWR